MNYKGKLYGANGLPLMNTTEDVDKLVETSKHLLHLHDCDDEGLSSGQPTPSDWFKAVNDLRDALDKF